jgi:cytosine/adenosine deaminase-related metal-dependent hydrolase
VVAAGSPESVGAPDDATVVDLPRSVLLPALVNVHAHLDLTHIGPQPPRPDFVQWVHLVRDRRATDDVEIARSVTDGARLARAGGTAIVGDIAGAASAASVRALQDSGLAGVSFLEVFGLGRRQAGAIEIMNHAIDDLPRIRGGVRLGLQPHAPYSCGPAVYRAAARTGLPLSTHLAETLEEIQLLTDGDGRLRSLLEELGAWDPSIDWPGCHPVEALADVFAQTPVLAAHLNYLGQAHLARLATWPITVAYCPRASAYFGHPRDGCPPHCYPAMLDAGIRVALGTDSLVCLDTPDRIGVLDDMRYLYRRDGTDPIVLLRMATTAGAEALGFDPALVTMSSGLVAGVLAAPVDPALATDPLRQVLERDDPPSWVVGPVDGARLVRHSSGMEPGS